MCYSCTHHCAHECVNVCACVCVCVRVRAWVCVCVCVCVPLWMADNQGWPVLQNNSKSMSMCTRKMNTLAHYCVPENTHRKNNVILNYIINYIVKLILCCMYEQILSNIYKVSKSKKSNAKHFLSLNLCLKALCTVLYLCFDHKKPH